MNQKAIQKWFFDTWKNDRVIIARTTDGRLWVSDIISLIAADETDPVLDSRKIFPEIPKPGVSLWSSKNNYSQGKGPDVQTLVDQTLQKDHKPLIVTDWYRFVKPIYSRMFKTQNEKEIFINAGLIDLIVGPKEEISDYQFLGTEPRGVVVVKNKQNELMALLMPIKNTESR